MMKNYQKPTMRVVRIQQTHIICTSERVRSIGGDDGFEFGGGGSGPANARGFDVDEWEDWE